MSSTPRRRPFTLRDAFLLALLLHALPVLLDHLLGGRLSQALMRPPEAAAQVEPEEKPMAFRFVDLPQEREPEAPAKPEFMSDRARRARDTEARPQPRIEQPRLAGLNEYEMTLPSPPSQGPLWRKPVTQPQPPSPSQVPSPEQLPQREHGGEPERRAARGETEQEHRAADFLKAIKEAAKSSPLPSQKGSPGAPPSAPGSTVDKFFSDMASQGYRNPDGSVSAIGTPTFDTAEDFDFGPYAKRLYWKVRSNWAPSAMTQYLGRTWVTQVQFDILKDGTVENLRIVKESGVPSYDREALYSILASYPLEPLPEGYKHDRVSVRFHYYYHIYY